MKKSLITALVLAACALGAHAGNFEGFSAGANVNLASTGGEYSLPGSASAKLSDADQNVSVQGAYAIALNNDVVLAVGATYGIGALNAGTEGLGGVSLNAQAKNIYSFYIEPGLKLTPTTLGYAKLAYVGMDIELSGALSEKVGFNGTGAGVGLRTLVGKNLFVQVEIMRNEFKKQSFSVGLDMKPVATVGTVGIGYMF